jgi:hypothetical protein
MPIYNMAHYIIVRESTSINSLKYLMLYFRSAIAAGEIEANNLYKTFLNLLL